MSDDPEEPGAARSPFPSYGITKRGLPLSINETAALIAVIDAADTDTALPAATPYQRARRRETLMYAREKLVKLLKHLEDKAASMSATHQKHLAQMRANAAARAKGNGSKRSRKRDD